MLSTGKLMFVALLSSIMASACTSPSDTAVKSPAGYNLGRPEKFIMPTSLLEVSGICFYKGNPDTIFAIQDEEGKFFRLGWNVKKQYNCKFGKKGDYEDVSILRDQAIILKSNGSLFTFPFADRFYEDIDSAREYKKILPEGEYEAMFGDEATGKLYILCKNCDDDNSKKNVTGYIYELNDSAKQVGTFEIDVKQIKAITGKVKRGFRPSGMAKNPLTNEWYIISAVNKMLIVTDDKWTVKDVYELNGNGFNQPEGIAFDRLGNLYISNEGDDLSEGNILKFMRSTAKPK